MNKLVLSGEGVFPVIFDRHGRKLAEKPATGLDMPGTIQGEGKLAGVPSLFVRLAGCNLRCIWTLPDGTLSRCDTPYASFDNNAHQVLTVEETFDLIRFNTAHLKHIVITGGEPLLQHKALAGLLEKIKDETDLHVSIETNGTLFSEDVARYTDLFSLSPKLSDSDPMQEKLARFGLNPSGPALYHAEKRRSIGILQQFIDHCRKEQKEFQLKFVTGRESDASEIRKDFLGQLKGWQPDDILLMPVGANEEELKATSAMVLKTAIRNGWRFSPRMHIDLFGSQPGV